MQNNCLLTNSHTCNQLYSDMGLATAACSWDKHYKFHTKM